MGGGWWVHFWNSVLHRARKNMITGVQRMLPEMVAGSSAQVGLREGRVNNKDLRYAVYMYMYIYMYIYIICCDRGSCLGSQLGALSHCYYNQTDGSRYDRCVCRSTSACRLM